MCGTTSYKRGESYYRSGHVLSLSADEDELRYEAKVKGSKTYKVTVEYSNYGDIHATCNCPAYDQYQEYCKHVAATLLAINDKSHQSRQQSESVDPWIQSMNNLMKPTTSIAKSPPSNSNYRVAEKLITLFNNSAMISNPGNVQLDLGYREQLQIEYIYKLDEAFNGSPNLTVELKIGVKRVYVVNKIKRFLHSVEQAEEMEFTKNFSYTPALHTIRPEDRAVLQLLIGMKNSEEVYRSNISPYGYSDHADSRELLIAPNVWEQLLPWIEKTNSKMEGHGAIGQRLQIGQGSLPLHYQLEERRGKGYIMKVSGLHNLSVLQPYQCVVAEGKLYQLESSVLRNLSELKRAVGGYSGLDKIDISSEQINRFVQYTIPALRQTGEFSIQKKLRDRIAEPELKSKLYLDFRDIALEVRLEFDYEGTVIHPLSELQQDKDHNFILIRNFSAERSVLELIEHAPLRRKENGWICDQEEDIYELLYRFLPQILDQVEVYYSQSVQSLLRDQQHRPNVKADLGANLDWLEISFKMEGTSEQEIRDIMRSIVEKKKFFRMKDGSFLSLEGEEFLSFAQIADQIGLGKSDIRSGTIKLPAVRALQMPERNEVSKSVSWGKSLRHFLENIREPERLDFEVPSGLEATLRDYQVQGFQWLKMLAKYRFGGILADDMGLGKTLQSIAYIVSDLQESTDSSPVLIVSPSSLTYNWENEFARFAPHVRVLVVAGQKAERSNLLDGIDHADVVVTSYPLLRRDIEVYKDMSFRTLILDEAQAIKNAGSLTAQVVKEITAARRFALTGTPIENSIDELWAIFDAIFPGLFPSQKAFRELSAERVARIIRPFILRRLKVDVLTELPDKIETVQRSELTTDQKKLYTGYLAKLQEDTAHDLTTEGFQKSRMKILAGITRLRQLCCHPSLFVEGYTGESGKLNHLQETVEDCLSSGKRLLVFSQFASMLQLIRDTFTASGKSLFYLDGQTPAQERVDMCRRFNEGEAEIFLISLKAGGTGLNLTGADTVVLYDLWWNPAVEEQAVGRAHRMGQKQVVQVIRLVTEGTIEEKMLELQNRKRDLIEQVIESGDSAVSSLTEQDIRELLMV